MNRCPNRYSVLLRHGRIRVSSFEECSNRLHSQRTPKPLFLWGGGTPKNSVTGHSSACSGRPSRSDRTPRIYFQKDSPKKASGTNTNNCPSSICARLEPFRAMKLTMRRFHGQSPQRIHPPLTPHSSKEQKPSATLPPSLPSPTRSPALSYLLRYYICHGFFLFCFMPCMIHDRPWTMLCMIHDRSHPARTLKASRSIGAPFFFVSVDLHNLPFLQCQCDSTLSTPAAPHRKIVHFSGFLSCLDDSLSIFNLSIVP